MKSSKAVILTVVGAIFRLFYTIAKIASITARSIASLDFISAVQFMPEGVLPINGLMAMCPLIGLHFHDWIGYDGVAF